MDQILGRFEDCFPQGGLKPTLRMNVSLANKYDLGIDLMTVDSRVSIMFGEKGRPVPDVPMTYVGDAHVEWHSRTLQPGLENSLTFLLPVDFDLLAKIEDIRHGLDVHISLWITFNGVERQTQGTIGPRVVSGEIFDVRSAAQGVSGIIARSKWTEMLNEWRYTDRRDAVKELNKTIQEAQEAKRQAEEAATAAKHAANLTAVTSLSEAYLEEATVLKRRSQFWGLISLLVATMGGMAMIFYVRQSMMDKFSLPEAVIRAVVIAAIFGVFTLCLRIYEAYRHLEVVNRHRVNIGRTYEAFKAAQPTEKAQEIMAAITADNMLAFGKSGFGGKDSPNQGPLAGTTELLKAILEKQVH